MSSHREAPEIAKDPVADSTDVYCFVSPDRPDTVTIIANYVPLQAPAGGPNFFEFGDEVLYEIHIDNDGDGKPDVTYQFRFRTEMRNKNTFLYNTGPIEALNSNNWNRRQFFSVTRVDQRRRKSKVLAANLPCPPCNIGPFSTPSYQDLGAAAVASLPGGGKVFCGQRAEGFYVDLGSIFDLANLRPFQNLHLLGGIFSMPGVGVNATAKVNVHTIAIQVPMTDVAKNGNRPTDVNSPASVIGVYTSASRRKVRILRDDQGDDVDVGPYTQVSRLGMPLFNEVLVPLARKDYWNVQSPKDDAQFAGGVTKPELAQLLPVLYPGVFPNLKALNDSGAPRQDLVAILLTGIPSGLIAGFQNSMGTTQADLLRLNMAIPPASQPNNLGLLGGDLAGFPNGRRVFDNTVTIELRALAGAVYKLIDPNFTPDGAASLVTDGLTNDDFDLTAKGQLTFLNMFPYLGVPYAGYDVPGGVTMAAHHRRVAHGHPAAHHHPHRPAPAEATPDPSFDGSVLADIGADVGALAVYASAALDGREIEIERIDRRGRPTHVAVRERRLSDGSTWAAFFPALAAGDYALHLIGEYQARPVSVAGGLVTEVHW